MQRKLPLVVVIGATACGKSKLAIELARKFGGEILSADSMQVYRGLDIVTNKVTKEEQNLAKHHLIDIIDPGQHYSVVDFTQRSLKIIGDLHQRDSLPIVVGGTNYYIEPLLWENFLIANRETVAKPEPDGSKEKSPTEAIDRESMTMIDREICDPQEAHCVEDLQDERTFFSKVIKHNSLTSIESHKLWQFLEKIDPEAALHYHYNNHRGITRALQIYQQSGKTYSDLTRGMNKSEEGAYSLGGGLRFEKTCVLYLSCDTKTLNKLVNDRVDNMIERGLIRELEQFHDRHNQKRLSSQTSPGYTKGVFQAIGFKEFHEYLILDPVQKTSDEGKQILEKCIKELKLTTSRYAKKQIKWVRSRFLLKNRRSIPDLFELPVCHDEAGWFQQVCEPALKIVDSYVNDKPLTDDLNNRRPSYSKDYIFNKPEKFFCKACDRTFIGSIQIEVHLQSRSHQRRVQSCERIEKGLSETDAECAVKIDQNQS